MPWRRPWLARRYCNFGGAKADAADAEGCLGRRRLHAAKFNRLQIQSIWNNNAITHHYSAPKRHVDQSIVQHLDFDSIAAQFNCINCFKLVSNATNFQAAAMDNWRCSRPPVAQFSWINGFKLVSNATNFQAAAMDNWRCSRPPVAQFSWINGFKLVSNATNFQVAAMNDWRCSRPPAAQFRHWKRDSNQIRFNSLHWLGMQHWQTATSSIKVATAPFQKHYESTSFHSQSHESCTNQTGKFIISFVQSIQSAQLEK